MQYTIHWTDLVRTRGMDPFAVLIRERNAAETEEVKDKGVCDASCITAGVDQGLGILIKVLLSLLDKKDMPTQ